MRRLTLSGLVLLTLSWSASATLELVENLESHDVGTIMNGITSAGPLGGVWDADDTSSYHTLRAGSVREEDGNKFIRMENRNADYRALCVTDLSDPIDEGETGMMFFRFYHGEGGAGGTDRLDLRIGVHAFTGDDPLTRSTGNNVDNIIAGFALVDAEPDKFNVTTIDKSTVLLSGLDRFTWYSFWLVVDNEADTIDLYVNPANSGAGEPGVPQGDAIGSELPFNVSTTSSLNGGLWITDPDKGNRGAVVRYDEIWWSGKGAFGPSTKAKGPHPRNGEEDVLRDGVELTWKKGEYAQTHDVYVGTDFNDVNDAVIDNTLGVEVYPGLDNNFLALDRREFGTVYYWRVDEVNAPTDPGLYKGNVWSFEVEPEGLPITNVNATASSSLTGANSALRIIDGSGLNDDDKHSALEMDMWKSSFTDPLPVITFEFTDVYKLHELIIWNANAYGEADLGIGVKDADIETSVDGIEWNPVGQFVIPQGPGQDGYAANPPLALGGVVAKFVRMTIKSNWGGVLPQFSLSEVRFTSLPVVAREPNPADGSNNLSPNLTLSWRAGREAALHEVRLGTDLDALDLVATPDVPSYEASLDLDQTYYWQITEVNDSETPSSWTGDVWSLSTEPYVTIDSFETYKDEWGKLVFQAWHDGLGWEDPDGNIVEGNGTGSAVGYWFPDTTEKNTVYDGKQAMPLAYDSTDHAVSEATFTMPEGKRDWTQNGIKAMSLMFFGAADNTEGELYIKVNGINVDTYLYSQNLLKPQWNAWTFDIPAGLSNVQTLTIGVKGGQGLLIIDAIRLYPMNSEMITPVVPDNTELLGHYPFEGNYNDISGNGLNGVAVGSAAISSDATRGSVVSLDGVDSCVDLGADSRFNFPGSFSVTAWVNSPEFTTNWGHTIFAKRGESGMGYSFRRYSGTQSWTFTVRGTTAADELVTNTDMSAYVDEWIQLTAVYDVEAGKRSIYMNGMQVASTNDSGTVVPNDHNVYIGARANSDNTGQDAGRYFIGMIDDVRFYNRALSHAEALGLAGQTDPIYKPFE